MARIDIKIRKSKSVKIFVYSMMVPNFVIKMQQCPVPTMSGSQVGWDKKSGTCWKINDKYG